MPPSAVNDAPNEADAGDTASARGEAAGLGFRNEGAQIQVIARAAAVLRVLEGQQDGLSLGQIAQLVSLPRSTVQRIVAALQAERLLIAASPTGKVRLGPALLRLASSLESDSVEMAKPILADLSGSLGETVDLATVRGSHLIFIDQVVGQQRLRTVSAVGESFPLYCTANGKAYLASLEDRQIADLIGHRYERRTAHTLTTLASLVADLEKVRQTGIAFDHEEHTQGICAAGVLVHDLLGNPLAVSVPVPTLRYQDQRELIVKRLQDAKTMLKERFGAEG